MRTDIWLGIVTIVMGVLGGAVSVQFIPKDKWKWKIFYFAAFALLLIAGVFFVVRLSNETAETQARADIAQKTLQTSLEEQSRLTQEVRTNTEPLAHGPLAVAPIQPSEVDRLCPDRLPFTLRKVPVPSPENKAVNLNLNYAAEITIRKTKIPMFRVKLYSRAGLMAKPIYPPQIQVSLIDAMQVVEFESGKPLALIKATLLSTEAIRIRCVNQEN